MLIQSLRPQTFSDVVGNQLNNKILMALAKDPNKGPSTILLQGNYGSGKAQPLNIKILTPSGTSYLGDIKVGDFVLDRYMRPTKVLGVYPQGVKDNYKIKFRDGRETCCCLDHLWSFYDVNYNLQTLSLRFLVQYGLVYDVLIPNAYEEKTNKYVPDNNQPFTKIESLEKIGECEMQCILVDNPEHLYLTSEYIVTHNTTSARLFARALNCKSLKENDICGKCPACTANLDSVPWYTEYDSTAMGNVDAIRDLRDSFIATSKSYNKVITLDEVHTMSRSAMSALLKVFEESPKGVYFILATTDPDKLLPTIRSRSLELVFTTKTPEEVRENIIKHATSLGLSLSEDVLNLIVSRSRGVMRDAHMLLDKVNLIGEKEFLNSDVPTTSSLNHYITSLLKKDKAGVLEAVSTLSRLPVANLKYDWQEYFLNLMRSSVDISYAKDDNMKKIVSAFSKNRQLLVNIVKMCISEWVIASFQNSIQAQTAMLALYQLIAKES